MYILHWWCGLNLIQSSIEFPDTACYDLIKLYVVPSVQTTSEITGQESNGKTGGRQTEETLDMGYVNNFE